MKTGKQGIELIKHFEGLHDGNLSQIGLQPKACPAGVYTVGYGHAIVDPLTHEFVTIADHTGSYNRAIELYPTMTIEQAEELLKVDLTKYELIVKSRVKRWESLEQYEFDAIVSHTFNTGGSGTLFNMIGREDPEKIREWWVNRYVRAGGVVLKGLRLRRLAEYHLFSTGELKYEWKLL